MATSAQRSSSPDSARYGASTARRRPDSNVASGFDSRRMEEQRMKDPDDELMWGFQRHFRGGLERELESALSAIGLPVEVRIVLVGFATGEGDQPRISVEPRDGPLQARHLARVESKAAERFHAEVRVSDLRQRCHQVTDHSTGSDGQHRPRRAVRLGDSRAPATTVVVLAAAAIAVIAGFVVLRSITNPTAGSLDVVSVGATTTVTSPLSTTGLAPSTTTTITTRRPRRRPRRAWRNRMPSSSWPTRAGSTGRRRRWRPTSKPTATPPRRWPTGQDHNSSDPSSTT